VVVEELVAVVVLLAGVVLVAVVVVVCRFRSHTFRLTHSKLPYTASHQAYM